MIFLSITGRRIPYAYLFTRMKSPTCRVGIIDPEGILNGSATKERSRKTTRMTGKKLDPYSTHHGSLPPGARFGFSRKASTSQMPPLTSSRMNRMSAKFTRQVPYFPSTRSTARKASCGISTAPTCFIRFLPAFCFSSSFFLRVMSPP